MVCIGADLATRLLCDALDVQRREWSGLWGPLASMLQWVARIKGGDGFWGSTGERGGDSGAQPSSLGRNAGRRRRDGKGTRSVLTL